MVLKILNPRWRNLLISAHDSLQESKACFLRDQAPTPAPSSMIIDDHRAIGSSTATLLPEMKTAVDTNMEPSQSMMASTSGEGEVSDPSAEKPLDPFTDIGSPLSSKKAFFSWLLLCYSVRRTSIGRSNKSLMLHQTGPTSSMTFSYVPISLQAMANILGHQPGSAKKCATRGAIRCLVSFGSGEVDYNSYV